MKHLILPVVTLSLIPMGVISRLVRANVLEILSQEFVGTLHAKGLLNRRVLYHTLKNAAPSALALMGLQFGYLLGGSILVETVFNWPGSGGLMNLAIFRRDVPVLSAHDRRARDHLRRHQYSRRRAAGADRPAHAAVGGRNGRVPPSCPPILPRPSSARSRARATGAASGSGCATTR